LVKKRKAIFFPLAELDWGPACEPFYPGRHCRAADFSE
jgi:hypothetical protein